MKQLLKNIEKALPEITVQLNMGLFGSGLDGEEVGLGCWVFNNDCLISCISDKLACSLPEDVVLEGDHLVTAIFYGAKDSTVIYHGPSNHDTSC